MEENVCERVRDSVFGSANAVHVNGGLLKMKMQRRNCVCVCVCAPIIRRQVSGLKWDQFPLVRACCSSVAVMDPLWSASTATNQE